MKIFYTYNPITDTCQQPCPCDKNNCRVGSVYCTQECPYCFGRSKDFNQWALFPNESNDKPFTFREIQYVWCAGVYKKLPIKTKIYCKFYRYVGKYIVNLIDTIRRNSLKQ